MSKNMTTYDVIARCLELANSCVKDGNGRLDIALMKEKFGEIAREVAPWNLSGEAKARLILRPMEERLVNIHGATIGRRLYWDFVESFWLQSWSEEPLGRSNDEPFETLIPKKSSERTYSFEATYLSNWHSKD